MKANQSIILACILMLGTCLAGCDQRGYRGRVGSAQPVKNGAGNSQVPQGRASDSVSALSHRLAYLRSCEAAQQSIIASADQQLATTPRDSQPAVMARQDAIRARGNAQYALANIQSEIRSIESRLRAMRR